MASSSGACAWIWLPLLLSCAGPPEHEHIRIESKQEKKAAPVAPSRSLRTFSSAGNSCAVEEGSGEVYCVGGNSHGERGIGVVDQSYEALNPIPVVGIADAARVVTGAHGACALLRDRSVWCWGGIGEFQSAQGGFEQPRPTPFKVAESVDEVSMGTFHLCVRQGGRVSCVGDNDRGQLGNAAIKHSFGLVPVVLPEDVRALASGFSETCALLASGRTYCWGARGLQTASQPTELKIPPLASIYADWAYRCGLTVEDRRIVCWGERLPSAISQYAGTYIPGVQGVAQLALGLSRGCALLEGGDLYCWTERADVLDGVRDDPERSLSTERIQRVASDISWVGISGYYDCARWRDGRAKCSRGMKQWIPSSKAVM